MDIAVNLVESYLRTNGYLTLSEFEVQRRVARDRFQTITDVDVMAVRFPGDVYLGDPHTERDTELLLIEDPALRLEADTVDVILGEVKQGTAEFNPSIRDHTVLHTMLQRVQWIYAEPIDRVIEGIQRRSHHISPALGSGKIRTRLVAFGRSAESDVNTIPISHVLRTMIEFMESHETALKPIQFKEPAPAMLRLLMKSGFSVKG